ncbi:hypothetical protein GCM10010498_50870 [Streptomyces cavourensis]|nr:hypothetical protein GCM10010498_50870 [Streptomyces cavourensis]
MVSPTGVRRFRLCARGAAQGPWGTGWAALYPSLAKTLTDGSGPEEIPVTRGITFRFRAVTPTLAP